MPPVNRYKENHTTQRFIYIATAIFFIIGSIAGVYLFNKKGSPVPRRPIHTIRIAVMPYSFSDYTIYVAERKGYFLKNGIKTKNLFYPHGMATLQALVDGDAQLAVCSETPFMHTFLNGNKICALAITITGDKHLAVVARKDRGIHTPQDMKGKRIGVTIGSNGEYFLDMVLAFNNLTRKNIHVIDLTPENMVHALMTGEVDGVATWNPQKHEAEIALGEKGKTFNADGLYTRLFIVAATRAYAQDHPQVIKKIIVALDDATRFIDQTPEAANALVTTDIRADIDLLNHIVPAYRFRLSLDQSFLTTLENQTRWAMSSGRIPEKDIPNFLEAIYPDALLAIHPENVTLIR